MRRDLHVMERICYIREQELGKAQAPQLEAVRWQAESGREVSNGNMEGGRR
jgi:hypothetical protein